MKSGYQFSQRTVPLLGDVGTGFQQLSLPVAYAVALFLCLLKMFEDVFSIRFFANAVVFPS